MTFVKGVGTVMLCSKCGYEGPLRGPEYYSARPPRMPKIEYLRWYCQGCGAAFRTETKEQEEARIEQTQKRLLAKHNRWYRRLARWLRSD